MKVKRLKVIHCDAGWRPWTFLKITTDSGIDGWSECSESNGSPQGIAAVLAEFEPFLIGCDPSEVERIYWLLYSRTRQSAGGVVQKAIAAVENALLDIKAKSLGFRLATSLGASCAIACRFTGRTAARLACAPRLSLENPRCGVTRTSISL